MLNGAWQLLLLLPARFQCSMTESQYSMTESQYSMTESQYCDEATIKISKVSQVTNQTSYTPSYRQFSGYFGEDSPHSSTTGALCIPAAAEDPETATGCQSGSDNWPCSRIAGRPWIALLPRGNCTFSEKINNSAAAGASGVIIYNKRDNELLSMSHPSAIHVAVLVSYEDGQLLLRIARYEANDVVVTIGKPDPPSGAAYDAPVAAAILLCAAIAIALNVAAIVSIRRTSRGGSHAAHSLFLVNLLVTDAAIGALGAINLCVMYRTLHDPCRSFSELQPSAAAAAPVSDGHIDDNDYSTSSGGEGGGGGTNIPAKCVSLFLMRATDILLYSNLLSVLLITGEQLVACRWPLRHRACMTRRSAAMLVTVSWSLSLLPELVTLALELHSLLPPVASAADVGSSDSGTIRRTLCELLLDGDDDEVPSRSWHKSLATIVVVGVVFAALASAYAYILHSVSRYSDRPGSCRVARNRFSQSCSRDHFCCIPNAGRSEQRAGAVAGLCPPTLLQPLPVTPAMAAVLERSAAARRRRRASAALTSCLLVGSFALSYSAQLYVQGGMVAHHWGRVEYAFKLHSQIARHLPIAPAVVDVLLCGILGAILDPIIYCARKRRVKAYISGSVQRTVSGTLQLLQRGSSALSRQGAAATAAAATGAVAKQT